MGSFPREMPDEIVTAWAAAGFLIVVFRPSVCLNFMRLKEVSGDLVGDKNAREWHRSVD